MNIIDSLTSYTANRIVSARESYAEAAAHTKYFKPFSQGARIAPHIRAEAVLQGSDEELWSEDWLIKYENEMLQKMALTISWIYSDIDLIARECGAVDLYAERRTADNKIEKLEDAPIINLLNRPNPYMTKTYLLRTIIYWLQISNRGAFLYLAPEVGNPTNIVEVWPINPNQIRVVRTKDKFVKEYRYYPKRGNGEYGHGYHKIDPRYVVWMRYPDPFFTHGSLPPLQAAMRSAEISLGIIDTQKKLFVDGKGLPLTLVSVDPDINNTDFATVKRDIRDDWEAGSTTIAVTRGGDISVASLGFSQRDLETIQAQELTRDEIDSVFFGYPIRNTTAFDGDGIKEGNRLVVDKTIYPLLVLIQEHFTQEIQKRFFDPELVVKFEDVRQYDKALQIQEKQVTARYMTIDELRERDGLAPLESPEGMEGLGALLSTLANNPQFVVVNFGLSPVDGGSDTSDGINAGQIPKQPGVGNVSGSLAPEATANRIIGESGAKMAIGLELKQRKKVALKSITSGESREFSYKVIPQDLQDELERVLTYCDTPVKLDVAITTIKTEWGID